LNYRSLKFKNTPKQFQLDIVTEISGVPQNSKEAPMRREIILN